MNEVKLIESLRLLFSPLTVEQCDALSNGDRDGQPWAPDYPTDGDLRQAHVLRTLPERAVGPSNPWGPYTLVEKSTGLCVGGIGFKGRPDAAGSVEIGYGICTSRQGQGLMSEAVRRLCELAKVEGARSINAETDAVNIASQRVLEKSGFDRRSNERGSIWWRFELLAKEA